VRVPAWHNPSVRRMAALFRYDHLPLRLVEVSKVFHDAAEQLISLAVPGQDTSMLEEALRKLWEAKNAAVVHYGFMQGD
jgi:hypothetical protein